MSKEKVPTNALDRALQSLAQSKSALPEFLRELGRGELWFVTAFHPEIIGETVEVEGGMRSPFGEREDEHGPYVPVYSSFERLEEAMAMAGLPPNQLAAASMEAVLVLELVAKMELRAALNEGCATGSILMQPDMMRDVADGSALQPLPTGGPVENRMMNIIDPADYPTDLLQPVFEKLRRHRNFRAAWVLELGQAEENGLRHFQFAIQMDPHDSAIYHEFALVLASAAQQVCQEVESGLVDNADVEYLTTLWQQAPPFYSALDYEMPVH